jgi:RNA polymerase primary sigma factor
MDNSSDKKQLVERILQTEYEKKGFLLEDDIIDICIEHDLNLVEIDNLCDKLLHQKMIVKDAEIEKDINDTESYVDRSHLDYDELLGNIKQEYPNCAVIIDSILDILPPQSKEWQTIITEAKNGNNYAKDRMIKMYLRTVMKQAYYYSKDNYCDFEEAFQNGVIGLINAIEKYDVTSPDLFPSYFPLWVRQYMQREGSIRGTILRYPAHYRDQLNIIVSDASSIIEDDNFEEAVSLVTDKAKVQSGLSDEEIINYILPYLEIPNDLETEEMIEVMLQSTMKEHIEDVLAILNDRERHVLELRYGIKDNRERTLEEVGGILSVTRERVRQIEAKALRKIKASKKVRNLVSYL